uniref:Hemagglutinin-esterase-fusion glycoprotein n=1 Tax=Ornate chorus frog influenza-like virus TaxID=2777033 RepID=A0A866W055_9ORTO|nr:hemagglutinin-esterase [Ornate chorus frog influenza-like virus]
MHNPESEQHNDKKLWIRRWSFFKLPNTTESVLCSISRRFIMLLILLALLAQAEAEKITRCITPRVNNTMIKSYGYGGGVFSSSQVPMTGVATPMKGVVARILDKNWVGFGDSRTDKSLADYPAVSDIPNFPVNNFVSASGASMLLSLTGVPGRVDFAYAGCGKEKVFYEGVNDILNNYDCYFHNNTERSLKFHRVLYKMSQESECLAYNRFVTSGRSSLLAAVASPTCSGTSTQNPVWYMNTAISPSNCGNENVVRFTLTTKTATTECKRHLLQFCYWRYNLKSGFNRDNCGDNYQYLTDSLGNRIIGFDQSVSGYPGGSDTATILCDYLDLPPGDYVVRSTPRLLLEPTRSICMGTGDSSVVEVYDSPVGGAISNPVIVEACNSVAGCIMVKRNSTYQGTYNLDHGDPEARRALSYLLWKNISCISDNGAFISGSGLFTEERMHGSQAGQCPLTAQPKQIPLLPSGLIIPFSGTDSLQRDLVPASRIFGLDDLLGFLIILVVAEGVTAGYFWGKKSGGGASVESTQAGFDKLGNDIQILRSDMNSRIIEINARFTADEKAIESVVDLVQQARVEALLAELGIIRSLIIANISSQMTNSLWELSSEITGRAKGLVTPTSPGCWIIDVDVCDESCQDYVFNFNGTSPIPTVPPIDTTVKIWGSGEGIALWVVAGVSLLISLLVSFGVVFISRKM